MKQDVMAVTGQAMLLAVGLMLLMTVALTTQLPATGNQDPNDADWEAFKLKYGKKYQDPIEETFRRAIRDMKLQTIRKHNDEASRGLHTYTLGENQLIDLMPSEYQKMLGYRSSGGQTNLRRSRRQASQPPMPIYYNTVSVSKLPATVNWTTSGWVGPVMNQGQCGSCWAYAATAAIEAQHKNHTGTWTQMSEQNLIDCSAAQGNMGCDGGNVDDAFWYVQTNGIESLAMYPDVSNVTGVSDQSCAFNAANSVTRVQSWRNVAKGSEPALQQAVALVGPVAAAIDANSISFQLYSGGVYSNAYCKSGVNYLDHAITVIGYGVYGTQPYWLIQNSWDTFWGINGYMMMARDDNNMCGIATAASFPVIG